MRQYVVPSPEDPRPVRYICTVCGALEETQRDLRQHIRQGNHGGRLPRYMCVVCEYPLHRTCDMRRHLREAHGYTYDLTRLPPRTREEMATHGEFGQQRLADRTLAGHKRVRKWLQFTRLQERPLMRSFQLCADVGQWTEDEEEDWEDESQVERMTRVCWEDQVPETKPEDWEPDCWTRDQLAARYYQPPPVPKKTVRFYLPPAPVPDESKPEPEFVLAPERPLTAVQPQPRALNEPLEPEIPAKTRSWCQIL